MDTSPHTYYTQTYLSYPSNACPSYVTWGSALSGVQVSCSSMRGIVYDAVLYIQIYLLSIGATVSMVANKSEWRWTASTGKARPCSTLSVLAGCGNPALE